MAAAWNALLIIRFIIAALAELRAAMIWKTVTAISESDLFFVALIAVSLAVYVYTQEQDRMREVASSYAGSWMALEARRAEGGQHWEASPELLLYGNAFYFAALGLLYAWMRDREAYIGLGLILSRCT